MLTYFKLIVCVVLSAVGSFFIFLSIETKTGKALYLLLKSAG